jgi:general secretion pathway protein F
MAVFEYIASEMDAKDVTSTTVADTPRQARDMLREKGLTVNQIRSADAPRRSILGLGRGHSGAMQAQTIEFIRELGTLLKAGIALLPALQTLGEGQSRRFKAVIQRLAD